MTKNQKLFNMIVRSRAIKQYVNDIKFDISDEFMLKLARNMDGITKHMIFKVFREVTGITNHQKLMDIYYSPSVMQEFDPIPSPFKSGDLVITPEGDIGVIIAGFPEGYWKTTLDKDYVSVQFINQAIDYNNSPYNQDLSHVYLLTLEFYSIDKVKDKRLKQNALNLMKFHNIYGGNLL